MSITVLCNRNMTELCPPDRQSLTLVDRHDLTWIVAQYDDEARLQAVTEDQVEDAAAWWREVGACNTAVAFNPEAIKEQGVLNYLCDEFGISSERNVAVAISELAGDACMGPIEVWNWCVENQPALEAA